MKTRCAAVLVLTAVALEAPPASALNPCIDPAICNTPATGHPCEAICNDPVCALDPDLQSLEIRAPGRCTSSARCYEAANGEVPDLLWDWVFERSCFDQDPHAHRPTADRPFLVEFGAGTFTMKDSILCKQTDEGHVTWAGAGTKATILRGNPVFGAEGCEDLELRDMAMVGDGSPYTGITGLSSYEYVTEWKGSGTSVWRNVEVSLDADDAGPAAAWYDLFCFGSHYFYNTLWAARAPVGASAFTTDCPDLWFYNSELRAEILPSAHAAIGGVTALHVSAQAGNIRVFGSALRVATDKPPQSSTFETIAGNGVKVVAVRGAELHVHASVLQADASGATTAFPVAGILTGDGSNIHVIDTAFDLRPAPGGEVRRFQHDPNVAPFDIPGAPPTRYRSPYHWASGPDAPVELVNNGESGPVDGRDHFVDTDCRPGGSCSGGSEPHPMIYRAACASEPGGDGTPWFDVVTGTCRAP